MGAARTTRAKNTAGRATAGKEGNRRLSPLATELKGISATTEGGEKQILSVFGG